MSRYLLTDVVEVRLTPVHNGRYSYYLRQHVMGDGMVHTAPAVNTKRQAEQSATDFFPNARVSLADGVLDFEGGVA